MNGYDVAIIGAGIAGASLAAELAPHARVVLLEAEAQPGYHSTGRSAAFWSETYGGPLIQPLTSASGRALNEGGFLAALGSLHIGRKEDRPKIEGFIAAFEGSGILLEPVDPASRVPGLRPEWSEGLLEPSCAYIDVAALHAWFLSSARKDGAELLCHARLMGAERLGAGWLLETAAGAVRAAIVVNAAGGWADQVAAILGAKPLGIQPYRRTLVQLCTEPESVMGMPHVVDISGGFYFKPEPGGRVWLTPHDETPVIASDVVPEELDVAIAIDRFEQVVDWRVVAVERKWAGLRSFAPDRLPVYGFDPAVPGMFWCAGQGGFGIQTSPAGAKVAAALLLGRAADDEVSHIDVQVYSPARFDTF